MYKVNYKHTFGQSEYMGVGEHVATIKKASLQEVTRDEQLKNGQIATVTYQHINILLENSKGEIAFDKIWQNLNEEQTALVYEEKRLNTYSVAVKIPDGTNFEKISDWCSFIEGRQLTVVVVENNYEKNGELIKRTKVSYVKPLEEEPIEVERGRIF